MTESPKPGKKQRIRLTDRDKYYLYEYGMCCIVPAGDGYERWREEWNERVANAPDNDPWKDKRKY